MCRLCCGALHNTQWSVPLAQFIQMTKASYIPDAARLQLHHFLSQYITALYHIWEIRNSCEAHEQESYIVLISFQHTSKL